jgi:hypothetical protein
MWRVAALFWVFIAPVAAGALVLAAMMTPGLQDQLGKWIVGAALAGFAVAIPIAWTIAKSFARQTA